MWAKGVPAASELRTRAARIAAGTAPQRTWPGVAVATFSWRPMDAFVAQKFARDGQAAPQGQRPQVQPQPVWLGPMQQSQSIPEAQVLQAPPVYYSYAAPPPPSLGAPVAGGYGPAAVPLLHPDDQLTCCAPSRSYIPFPVHPLCQCGPVAYQPVPEYGSGKCGRRVICGRTTFEQRDCLGRPCTPHRMLTLAACIILIATSIITGLSSAKSIPVRVVCVCVGGGTQVF